MMTFVTGIVGIVMLFVFMGIVLWWVKALPLIVICAVVAALLLFDFYQTLRFGSNGNS